MIFLLERSPNQPLGKVEPNTKIEYIYINNLKSKLYKYVYDGRRI